MANVFDNNDIIMTENNPYSDRRYLSKFNLRLVPKKRNYLEMLSDSNQTLISRRLDNYLLLNKNKKSLDNKFSENVFEKNAKRNNLINDSNYLDISEIKKKIIVKKKLEYDEEKEKKFVENYYKIKNRELNKLRFGNE